MKSRFPRIPLLFTIAALAAACCACSADWSKWNGAGTNTAKTPASAILASPVAKQGINDAVVPPSVMQATSAPLPTLDINATQAALIAAVATANGRTNQLERELADQKLAALQVQAQIERAKADAAKYEAANRATSAKETQTAVDAIANTARQIEAENARKQADAELIRAQTEREQGSQRTALLMLFIGVMDLFGLLMYRAMTRPHVNNVVATVKSPYSHEADNLTTWTRREVPAGVDEAHLIILAKGVRTERNANAAPFTRRNWLHVFSRSEWDALIAYMIENNYAAKTSDNDNAPCSLTPSGEGYLYQFEQLEPHPTEGENISYAELSRESPPGQSGQAQNRVSGGASDHFGIISQDGKK